MMDDLVERLHVAARLEREAGWDGDALLAEEAADEIKRLRAHIASEPERVKAAVEVPRPFRDWSDDEGDVLWWLWPIQSALYVGSPLDCGYTVEAEINLAASDGHREKGKMQMDVGGWPWSDADEKTEARLFWTPLPDAQVLDVLIRDYIRGGPEISHD